MIHTGHGIIRTAEPEDAPAFQQLYDAEFPRAALLSRLREPAMPTRADVRELFKQRGDTGGTFYAIEDSEGRVLGFCGLRTSQELRDTAFLAELMLHFCDVAHYASPLADDAFEWMIGIAFRDRRLNKLVAHALEGETALCDFLRRSGFESNGVQREVLFACGKWHNMETFTLFNPNRDKSISEPETNA